MTASKDEMEIVSTYLSNEDAANCLSSMRELDKKAEEIAKTIVQTKKELQDLQSKGENTNINEKKICDKKKQLSEMVEEYKCTIKEVLKLAKMINFEVENLEYRKIDIGVMPKKNISYAVVDKIDEQLLNPVIILNNCSLSPNVFAYDDNNNETKILINNCHSMCSCKDESEIDSDCEENHNVKNNCCQMPCETTDNDYEKEQIRDDLMSMKGEVKLLHQQNRDLLCKLNSSNQRSLVLSNAIRNKSDVENCKEQSGTCVQCPEDIETENKTKMFTCEINRLRDELKEMKRDRCQIELARKILNVSDSQCTNCVGSTNPDTMTKLKEANEENKRLFIDQENKKNEIVDLRKLLEKAKHESKNFEDCLSISKAQIVQLETQLFDFNSAKSHDTEVARSNDKYLIESLRNSLNLANEEKTNMQMVLDFHLTELEDKKMKYLAVLQTKQEQKHRIETLCKEKNTIAKEYESEFNRMNEHLQKRLEEIEKLPAMLAEAQQFLEKEKSTRIALENELELRLEQISSLTVALSNAENKIDWHEESEDEKLQLRASINTLNDTLMENERLYMERTHDSLQLKYHLDALREEAAIQVTNIKDFSECQRLKYTDYIQKLEHQLAECRAMACSEFKKRDHVDQRLRDHIKILTNNLNEAHKQIGELSNARNLIETKTGNNLCKIPRTLKSSCKVLNNPTSTEND